MRHVDFCESKCFYNLFVYTKTKVFTSGLFAYFFSSNPKKRYELFLKATQLDVIIEKLNDCLTQTNLARGAFKTQARQHQNNLEIQKKAHEKLNQFRSMEPLKVS